MSTPKKPAATKKTSKKTVVEPQVSIDVRFDNTFPKVEFDDNVKADLRKKIETILLAPSIREMIKAGQLKEAADVISEKVEKNIIVEEFEGRENTIYIEQTFIAATVKAVRWEYELGHLVRKVRQFNAYSSEDLANEPAKSQEIEVNLKERLRSDGWFFSDRDACLKADQNIECDLDQYAHDLLYRKACRVCIAKKIRQEVENLRILRDWVLETEDIYHEIQAAKKKAPRIIPDLEKYHLENGEFVRNEPEIEFERLNVSPEKKKALVSILKSITEDNKEKK